MSFTVDGPERLRLVREELADECDRLCCRLGITPALRAAYRETVAEGIKPEEQVLLDRMG